MVLDMFNTFIEPRGRIRITSNHASAASPTYRRDGNTDRIEAINFSLPMMTPIGEKPGQADVIWWV